MKATNRKQKIRTVSPSPSTRRRGDRPSKPRGIFATWLHGRFLDFQRRQGYATISDWARALNAPSRDNLNRWMLGTRVPDAEGALWLAKTFGVEVYDYLGMDRPDAILASVVANWGELEDDDLEAIRGIVERAAIRRAPGPADGGVAGTHTERETRGR